MPGVVPELPPPPPPPPLPPEPPHANRALPHAIDRNTIPSNLCDLPRRAGIQNSRMQMNTEPLAVIRRVRGLALGLNAALVAAIVEMVSVAVPTPVPVIFTGVVAPKLRVGGY